MLEMIYPSGTIIANRYEVVQGPHEKRTLVGGMGLVYLCVDHAEAGRPVVLKTFKPHYLPNRAARDRFSREGTTWVSLGRHPHIVRCDKVIQPGGGLEMYLVLELVAAAEGKDDASLRAWLKSGKPLPMAQALMFALHIARGMKHATMTIPDLVHRELKPENVLVGRDGRARVTDFGLAHVLQGADDIATGLAIAEAEESQSPIRHTRLTRGVGAGTPEYMAPEQWERREIDQRADIYALGVAYLNLGDYGRAIAFHEQRLAIAREIRNVRGAAMTSLKLALLLSEQGQAAEALRHAEFAAQVFTQMGHTQYAQMAQQLIARMRV